MTPRPPGGPRRLLPVLDLDFQALLLALPFARGDDLKHQRAAQGLDGDEFFFAA